VSRSPVDVDDLAGTILGLPAERLWCLFDRLAGRPEVAAAGWHIAERRLTPRPNAKRDAELLRLHNEDGLSYADIASAKHLRRGTVAKAIQRERRREVDKKSLSTEGGRYAS
jgi:DNA-directed RNA polymerase specialized sigma24 family protein